MPGVSVTANPLPLAGEGGARPRSGWEGEGLCLALGKTLTPTLSRKRERERAGAFD
jgi:hypothetical protein